MQKIENIILDYGNVIFMIDFIKSQDAFTQLGIANASDVFAHHGQIKLFDDFDRGMISPSEFRNEIRILVQNSELSDKEIDDAWNALLIGVPEGKHEILLGLKEKYRTFLLSNNNAIHYEYCMRHLQEDYNVPDNSVFFERTYYSHLVGMRKPDPEIFDMLLKETGIDATKTLFVDDSPQHLETARTFGICTALCSAENPLEKIVKDWDLL